MYFKYENNPELVKFYGSKKWKECRRIFLSLHPICERCEKLGIINKATHVHHKDYLTPENFRNPEMSLNFDNLEALCVNCHHTEHHKNSDCIDGLFFDADGNIRKA